MSKNIYTLIINQKAIVELSLAGKPQKTLIADLHSKMQALENRLYFLQNFSLKHGETPEAHEEKQKIFIESRNLLEPVRRLFCEVLEIGQDIITLDKHESYPWDLTTFYNGREDITVSCLFVEIDEKLSLFKTIKEKQKTLEIYLSSPTENIPTNMLGKPLSQELIMFLQSFPYMPKHIFPCDFRAKIIQILTKHTFPALSIPPVSPIVLMNSAPSSPLSDTRRILNSIRFSPLIEELKGKLAAQKLDDAEPSATITASTASPMWSKAQVLTVTKLAQTSLIEALEESSHQLPRVNL
jgi:hypothetical protein